MSTKNLKNKKPRKMSKRESEIIVFEANGELLHELPIRNHEFSSEITPELRNYIDSVPAKVGHGVFRLLNTQIIMKKFAGGTGMFITKPRILNIPYSKVKHAFEDPKTAGLLIFAVESNYEHGDHYELVKFDKPHMARECLEALQEQGYGDSAKATVPRYDTDVEHSESVSPVIQESPLFESNCELRQFDMRLFHNWPETLPKEITDSMEERNLDQVGHFSAFESGANIKNSSDMDARKIWTTDYSKVSTLFVENDTHKQFLFAIEDMQSRPNHYNMVRFPSRSDELIQAFERKGGRVEYVGKPVTAPLVKEVITTQRRYSTDSEVSEPSGAEEKYSSPIQTYKQRNDYYVPNEPLVVESSSPVAVRSAPQYEKPQRAPATERGFVESKYKKDRLPLMHSRSVRSKQDLMNLPDDDGKWEYDCTTLSYNPMKGTNIDENGSILFYVAHRLA